MATNDAEVREREQIVKSLTNQIKIALSDIENPQAVERQIAHLDGTIAKLTRERDLLVIRLADGPQQLRDMRDRVKALRKEILFLENAAKIDKLLALQATLQGVS